MPIHRLGSLVPRIDPSAFVADGAQVIGNVSLKQDVSVWFNAVIRGDNDPIGIGEGTNIQDGAVLHADPGFPLVIGQRSTIGHQAMVHGCTIGNGVLIGIQTILLNGAQIGDHCIIGAGALVTGGTVIPPGSMAMGSPAKVTRPLRPDEIEMIDRIAQGYIDRSLRYRSELSPANPNELS